jgi:transcriptional regulator with XRE-family HTH domain
LEVDLSSPASLTSAPGNRVREVREYLNRSVPSVADETGLSQTHLRQIEAGTVIPTIATARKLCAALGGVTLDRLFPNQEADHAA